MNCLREFVDAYAELGKLFHPKNVWGKLGDQYFICFSAGIILFITSYVVAPVYGQDIGNYVSKNSPRFVISSASSVVLVVTLVIGYLKNYLYRKCEVSFKALTFVHRKFVKITFLILRIATVAWILLVSFWTWSGISWVLNVSVNIYQVNYFSIVTYAGFILYLIGLTALFFLSLLFLSLSAEFAEGVDAPSNALGIYKWFLNLQLPLAISFIVLVIITSISLFRNL